MYALLQESHGLLRQGVSVDSISSLLSPWASALFEFLPPFIMKQIEMEKLLVHLVEAEFNRRLVLPWRLRVVILEEFNFHHPLCPFLLFPPHLLEAKKKVLSHISYHMLAAWFNGYMATLTFGLPIVASWTEPDITLFGGYDDC
ncbi:hypothetical protein ACH5RR_034421 [Cinchona calisaya]|uniref:Maturase K n=1 Tax=Cinchona calisaya TaxID=153742 RepID=A0ABD2YFE7_9GENT